ncbi:MAG: MMCAP2_0565 family pilin-like conjugal transfer protein [bacterium]
MKSIKIILTSFCIISLLAPGLVMAQGDSGRGEVTVPLDRVNNIVTDINNPSYDQGTDEYSLTQLVGTVVSVFLGLLGVVFVILIIYAGYTWMTASGNDEKVSKAGRTIKVAVIGLLIVIGAFAIWRFVFERIVEL